MLRVRNCGVRRCVVRSSLARHGFISALRGLALYGTVLSCPVRLCKLSLWSGGAVSCPAGSSGVWLCKVWRFLVRSCCVGRSTLERGFVLQGKVTSWSGEVLFAAVGLCGVLCTAASFWRGIVWLREALFRVVKFGPVKHCYVRQARALLRLGIVRHGTVECGFARLRAAGQALVSSRSGMVTQGYVMRGAVRCSTARRSLVSLRLGWDWQDPVMHGIVKRASAMQGILRYGGYKK